MNGNMNDCEKCAGKGEFYDMMFITGYSVPKKVAVRCGCRPPICIFCEGNGWCHIDKNRRPVPIDEVVGEILPVIRCDCKQLDDVKTRIKASGLPDKYQDKIKLDRTDGNKTAIMYIEMAYKKFKEGKDLDASMLFFGPNGTGKTTVLSSFFKSLASENKRSLSMKWVNFKEFIQGLKNKIGNPEEFEALDTVDDISGVDLLFIDDLFASRGTTFEVDVVEQIVSFRYDRNLPVFLSTNLMHDELFGLKPALGDRTMSRLSEICQIAELKGTDYRKSNVIKFQNQGRRA